MSVSGIGDLNTDGVPDVLTGAYRADSTGELSGTSYVVFGGAGVGTSGSVELSTLSGADGFALKFIPESDRILVASDLLNYQGHEVLEFTAPAEPGDYEILCTFPGHRATMNGIMRVER